MCNITMRNICQHSTVSDHPVGFYLIVIMWFHSFIFELFDTFSDKVSSEDRKCWEKVKMELVCEKRVSWALLDRHHKHNSRKHENLTIIPCKSV